MGAPEDGAKERHRFRGELDGGGQRGPPGARTPSIGMGRNRLLHKARWGRPQTDRHDEGATFG